MIRMTRIDPPRRESASVFDVVRGRWNAIQTDPFLIR